MDWTALVAGLASGPFSLIIGAGTRLATAWMQERQEKIKAEERVKERAHEIDMRRLDMEAAEKKSEQELRALTEQGDVSVMTAAYKTWQPTGVKWVDAWNAVMRPGSFTLLWILWIWLHGLAWLRWPESAGLFLAAVDLKALLLADVNMLLAAMAFVWADRSLRKRMGA